MGSQSSGCSSRSPGQPNNHTFLDLGLSMEIGIFIKNKYQTFLYMRGTFFNIQEYLGFIQVNHLIRKQEKIFYKPAFIGGELPIHKSN